MLRLQVAQAGKVTAERKFEVVESFAPLAALVFLPPLVTAGIAFAVERSAF